MTDYRTEIALAQELLEQFGMSMELVRIEHGAACFDPVTGLMPAPTVTSIPFMGVKKAPSKEERESGALQGAGMVVLAPEHVGQYGAPSTSDKLRFAGHEWDIVSIAEVAPAASVILYKFGIQDAGTAAAVVEP